MRVPRLCNFSRRAASSIDNPFQNTCFSSGRRRRFKGLESRSNNQGAASFHIDSSLNTILGDRNQEFLLSTAFDKTSRSLSSAAASEDDNDSLITCTHRRSGVRNVAVVAHVDHGKTTLVDQLLKACSSDQQGEERLLDCGELEKERGITISSKVTRCDYKDTVVNIVDTPGKT